MNLSRPFIRRPIGSTMLALAILLAGWLAWRQLPVAPLPQIDTPMVVVTASLPGASPTRSEEHTSELPVTVFTISYAVFCL